MTTWAFRCTRQVTLGADVNAIKRPRPIGVPELAIAPDTLL